jgi:hypothetical protein
MLSPGHFKPTELAKIPDEESKKEPKDFLHIQCFWNKEYGHYLTSKECLMHKCHGRGPCKRFANATWQEEQEASMYLLIQMKE